MGRTHLVSRRTGNCGCPDTRAKPHSTRTTQPNPHENGFQSDARDFRTGLSGKVEPPFAAVITDRRLPIPIRSLSPLNNAGCANPTAHSPTARLAATPNRAIHPPSVHNPHPPHSIRARHSHHNPPESSLHPSNRRSGDARQPQRQRHSSLPRLADTRAVIIACMSGGEIPHVSDEDGSQ
jgi:hypothetical protein